MQILLRPNIHFILLCFFLLPSALSWMPPFCSRAHPTHSRFNSLVHLKYVGIDKRHISKARRRASEASADRSQSATSYPRTMNNPENNNLENSPTLVLNADYTPMSYIPLSVWCWQDTLRAVFAGKAVVVAEYDHLLVRSVSCSFKLPSVIALKEYHKKPSISPVMSKRYVFIRDNFRCQVKLIDNYTTSSSITSPTCILVQYCLEQFPPEQLSLDHVIPRCRGGKLTWTNTVCSCLSCNYRKGHLMPEELPKIGMRLKTPPYEPSHSEIQSKGRARRNKVQYHPDWRSFV